MKKRGNWLLSAIGMLLVLCFALVLFGVFYGVMAYQLAGGEPQEADTPAVQGALLALPDAQLVSEQMQQQEMGGALCTVTTRIYKTQDGLEVEAVSASPAAYIARLSEEGWTAQLITGFTLAGLDAVYSVRGKEGMLSAREGERIYMLRCAANEQTLYEKGTLAKLQDNKRGYGCEE